MGRIRVLGGRIRVLGGRIRVLWVGPGFCG